METQKIINLLNDSSNEESKFATKKCRHRQSNYRQSNSKRNTTKTVLSNLKQKVLNQVFVIILTHLF